MTCRSPQMAGGSTPRRRFWSSSKSSLASELPTRITFQRCAEFVHGDARYPTRVADLDRANQPRTHQLVDFGPTDADQLSHFLILRVLCYRQRTRPQRGPARHLRPSQAVNLSYPSAESIMMAPMRLQEDRVSTESRHATSPRRLLTGGVTFFEHELALRQESMTQEQIGLAEQYHQQGYVGLEQIVRHELCDSVKGSVMSRSGSST